MLHGFSYHKVDVMLVGGYEELSLPTASIFHCPIHQISLRLSCTSSWTLLTHPLKAAAWLQTTVDSLRDFSHLRMVSCKRGLEVGETPARGLDFLVKVLFSGEPSLDFPGRVTEGSGPGYMAYHLA